MGRRREALPGGRTLRELEQLIRHALQEKLGGAPGDGRYLWVRDLTDEWVVYELEGYTTPGCFKATYTVDAEGDVVLGEPAEVEPRTVYDVTESTDRIPDGRVLEAKGEDAAGGRVFRVRIIRYGDSKNGRRYSESVLRKAGRLYEGAKAYDHHRTDDELRTSTIHGLAGSFRNVEASSDGLDADLHLLPSATHVAEALDASLAQQAANLPPLVGVSHDVMARYKPIVDGGRRLQEATEIVSVNSADIVADPAAGGQAIRMVAGGDDSTTDPEEGTMTLEELLELLNGATDEQKQSALSALGISADDLAKLAANDPAPPTDTGEGEKEPVPAGAGTATESIRRDSVLGRTIVRAAVADAGIDERLAESIRSTLPESFTEAQVNGAIENVRRVAENLELAGLEPRIPNQPEVTKEERDRKVEALDAFFAGDFRKGYRSFKEAWVDFSGTDPRRLFSMGGEDINRLILRESLGVDGPYDSSRSTESADTGTWAQALGDSITRRMIAEYNLQALSNWRSIVSSIVPVNDFRTQRIDRLGGYGILPTVGEGAPYQALTTPGDEEATYSLTKKGGTEDLTLEAIANDDVRLVQRIPVKLGRAAALTLYRFVWDFLKDNPTLTYDSVALFAAGHNNTDSSAALAQSTLSTGRRKMREQPAYGDTDDVLGAKPRFLVVPPELEEIGFQLATSAVAIPSSGNDTNIPNMHQGLDLVVIDYYSDANDWFLIADPSMIPTIEVGFYQGREDPELFAQTDPTVGSVFTADKITWKIRHIYSGAVLDHRAFYRGQG